jgi:hypothetical protein
VRKVVSDMRRPMEEPIEPLEERVERLRSRGEDDEEAALEELIEVMVPRERASGPGVPAEPTRDEFTCTSCRLIRPRTCLADPGRLLCTDCVGVVASPAERAPDGRVEAPCPACGTLVMVPERDDAACGFFCPECGAHVARRGGHLHLFWNHRYHPDHLLPGRPTVGS